MFIISELGVFVKTIVSLVGYLLFLPINLLDTLVFSKLFEGEFVSIGVSFALLVFILFLVLGITSRIFLMLLKLGIVMFILYLLSDMFAGIFLVFILIHMINKYQPFKKKQFKA